MSYYQIFDRRFIKTTRGIIPMVLVGDSSLRDKHGAMVKHWSVYNQELIELTPDQMAQKVRKYYEGEPDMEVLKFRSQWLPRSKMEKWFAQGCKDARTVEEYLLCNCNQRSVKCGVVVFPKKGCLSRTLDLAFCKTTAELERWMDGAREMIAEYRKTEPESECFMEIGFSKPTALNLPRAGCTSVVARIKDSYVTKIGEKRKSIHCSPYRSDAKVFDSVEQAVEELGDWMEMLSIRFVAATPGSK